MPRIARVVVPGMPYHGMQRGNRRANVFFEDADRRRYLWLLEDYARKYGLKSGAAYVFSALSMPAAFKTSGAKPFPTMVIPEKERPNF